MNEKGIQILLGVTLLLLAFYYVILDIATLLGIDSSGQILVSQIFSLIVFIFLLVTAIMVIVNALKSEE